MDSRVEFRLFSFETDPSCLERVRDGHTVRGASDSEVKLWPKASLRVPVEEERERGGGGFG